MTAPLAACAEEGASPPREKSSHSVGALSVSEPEDGVAEHAYVVAPPGFLYVVERERGSFLDCGEGFDARLTDEDGRDAAPLTCGVTLTETVVIPAASSSARLIVHY